VTLPRLRSLGALALLLLLAGCGGRPRSSSTAPRPGLHPAAPGGRYCQLPGQTTAASCGGPLLGGLVPLLQGRDDGPGARLSEAPGPGVPHPGGERAPGRRTAAASCADSASATRRCSIPQARWRAPTGCKDCPPPFSSMATVLRGRILGESSRRSPSTWSATCRHARHGAGVRLTPWPSLPGAAGAGHCLGMCSGLAGGLAAHQGWGKLGPILAYHGSRIAIYVALRNPGRHPGRTLVQTGALGKGQGLLMILAGLVIGRAWARPDGLLPWSRPRRCTDRPCPVAAPARAASWRRGWHRYSPA